MGERRKETPFIVRVFDKYIEDYSINQGVIVAEPKSPLLINSLAFRAETVGVLGFGETKWYLTATYEAVGRAQMNRKAVELYRRLKGMECQAEIKGLIMKKISFKPHESLAKLKDRIPALQVSDGLSQALEKNEKVTRLVKMINPGEMSIRLHSIPELNRSPNRSTESADAVQAEVYHFNKPSSVTWVATLSTLFHEGLGVQRKAALVIHLFYEIFETVRAEMNAS